MNSSSQTTLFNQYLADKLSDEEKAKLEEELNQDEELAIAFEKHRQILEGMQGARRAHFQLYRDIEGEQPFAVSEKDQTPWYVWVLIASVILGIFWLVSEYLF